MPRNLIGPVLTWTTAIVLPLTLPTGAVSQTVWSGLTFEFTRPSFVNPAPVDQITPGVHIARAATQGIYNAAPGKDLAYNGSGPTGTRWATDLNNAGKTIEATNNAALTFGTWLAAYGGFSIGNVIEGKKAVVHLIDENIYLDLQFTNWVAGRGEPGGGGFTYLRAEPPITPPMATGDYNENGVVDAADYVLWRDTLEQTVNPAGIGADGDMSGTVDSADYEFWRARFGNMIAGSASGTTSAIVPEPASVTIAFLGWVAIVWYPAGQSSVRNASAAFYMQRQGR
jgi:hypothetical protein